MLVANGCSFVWGDELEGYDDSTPSHWKLTFPKILSDKLNCPYVNLAECGSGNDKIFRDTIKYLSSHPAPKYLVILWSSWQREEIADNMSQEEQKEMNLKRWDCMSQVSRHRLNASAKYQEPLKFYFRDIYNLRQGIVHTLTHMNSIQLLCDSMGIKLVQGVFHKHCWENLISCMHPSYVKENWGDFMKFAKTSLGTLRPQSRVGLGHYTDFYSFAEERDDIMPFGHPGKKSHREYSDLLLHILLDKNL